VRENRFDTLVSYVLNCYKPQPDHSQTLDGTAAPGKPNKWVDRELANFCYLFEHMLTEPFPVFITEAEGRYAAAEMLFGLIATGITPSSTLRMPCA
jgi:hypothetical protein